MTLPDPASSRVVLIGASRFTDPELPDLPAVRNNLDGLAECLAQTGRCTVVADPESPVALVDPIHDAAAAAEDTLVIYYAGHGLIHPRTLGLLLAVVGSAPGRTHTAVPYDLVRENVIDSPARRKVVILDCCYSGRAIGGMADPTTALVNEATVEGTYLLASAPPNKQALSPPGERFTAFTGALLAVLREGIADGPQHLHLDLIYRQVRDALKRAALPVPQLKAANTAGELALIRNPWRQPVSEPTPVTPVVDVSPAKPGLLANRYELGKAITDKVSLATDTHTKQTVVVKRLPAEEAIRLDHRNIVRVLDILPDHVVMEYIAGQTLQEIIRSYYSAGRMKAPESVHIIIEICNALEFAQQHGAAIGGLGFSSSDVMLDRSGVVKVLNVRRRKHLNVVSDLHKVGRLLVELLTGTRPSFGQVPPGIPWRLRGVARKVVDGRPSERYQTFDEFKRALRARMRW